MIFMNCEGLYTMLQSLCQFCLHSASLKQYTSFQIITAQQIKKSQWKKVTKAATTLSFNYSISLLDSFTKRSDIVAFLKTERYLLKF